jgi:hypothetical protein
MRTRILPTLRLATCLSMAACSGDPTSSEVTGSAREPSAASETGAVLVGAGDIGDCGSGGDEIALLSHS